MTLEYIAGRPTVRTFVNLFCDAEYVTLQT